jgi:diguanylate cyclase (GGDEF)-like protein
MVDLTSGVHRSETANLLQAAPRRLSEQLLRNIPMFAGVPDSAIAKLAAGLEGQFAPAGATIFSQGHAGDSLFIIERGEVAIKLPDEDGGETILARMGPGEFFGELALLDGQPRSATAEADSDAQLLKLGRAQFLEVLRQPQVLESVLVVLSQRIRTADTLVSVTGIDNRKLREEARTDALTKLGNRRRLREDLETLNARALRYGYTYALAMCDIDFFKRYNDRYGHTAGDEVLRQVAATLAAECRSGDAVYRYGGEEFVIVMPQQTIQGANIGMERIRSAIQNLALEHVDSEIGVVTISGGIAALDMTAGEMEAPLSDADKALYEAKRSGRNCVHVYAASGAV